MTPAEDGFPRIRRGVALRRLSPSDLETFQGYRRDPDLGRFQGWSAMSDADARAFLDEMSAAALFRPGVWSQIAIADGRTLALLGDIGLRLEPDGTELEIGFTLRKAAQGNGVATIAVAQAIELAFECTGIHRVHAITDARNLPSIRLLERCGMRRLSSADARFRGERCVELKYGIDRAAAAPEGTVES